MEERVSYRKIAYLAMFVQFVNFLEFMMINPLSPDYIVELGIISSDVGWIIGAYSFSACLFGFFASSFVDKYDRKTVLLVCFGGMAVGSLACIFSYNFLTIILSRIIAGGFGGPATAITTAILLDFVPEGKRGKAFGKMMTAFPLAAIVGIPLALEISRLTKWQFAYGMVLVFEIIIMIAIYKILPNVNAHITSELLSTSKLRKMYNLISNKKYRLGIASFFLTFFSFFLIVPIIPPYFIFNLGFPRDNLAMLFFIGGALSFFAVRYVGRLSDKYDAFTIVTFITILFIPSVVIGYSQQIWQLPPLFIFVSFMLCVSTRNAALVIATSKLPSNQDRAGYLALQNSIQNLAVGAGGFISGALLSEGENLQVVGISKVVFLTVIASLLIPFFVKAFENRKS
jgi:predicted MFS family arabinose efflux permease